MAPRLTPRVTALVSALVLLASAPALAATTGPVYPLPGGPGTGHGGSTCLSSPNDPIAMGSPGGRTWYFGGGSDPAQTGTGCPFSDTPTNVPAFDTSRFERLFWGVSSTPQLALDGFVDAPGETMTYSPTLSDRSTGTLVWTGSTTMTWCQPASCVFTTSPVATEFVLQARDLAGTAVSLLDPATVGVDPSAGGVVEVTADLTRYQVNLQMLADDPATAPVDYKPAITMYNSYNHQNPPPPQTVMSVGGGFSFISRPPTGAITGDPVNHVTSVLTADATDPDGTIASYAWDTNNDGVFDSAQDTGNGATANVDFGPGDHPVAVQVTDDDGVTTTLTRTITIVNQAPVAAFSCVPTSVDQGVESVCTSTSTDPDAVEGDTLTQAWDLNGDGDTTDPTDNGNATQVHVSYPDAGAHLINLVVTDRDGGQSTTSVTLQVADVTPPTVGLTLTKQRIASIIKNGIRGTLTSDEAGTATLQATLSRKLARKLKLKNPVARGTATLSAPGHVAVTLKLTRAAKRKFKTLGSVALKVTARVTDQAANVGTASVSRTYKK